MALKSVEINNWTIQAVNVWQNRWFLLTSGDEKNSNSMTVAWGSFGVFWNKPVAMVVVRPSRHTFGFMEKSDCFSLCSFPEKFRNALNIMGTFSGRDLDKTAKSGLTHIPGHKIPVPAFQEADLVIECRKIFSEDMNPRKFLDPAISMHYKKNDYHRIYVGEILGIFQESK